jgi:hypothetical protein
MPEQSAEWTGPWLVQQFAGKTPRWDIQLLTPQVLQINRSTLPPFVAATIASSRVEPSSFQAILQTTYPIEIIVNVPRESFWTGQAIALASQNSVAFGGVGDLLSASSLPDVRQYVNKEFAFVERILRQHSKVKELEREHDRKYVVKRVGSADVSVVLLNEYDLAADHVRTARDRYGAFAAILLTNPNARLTASAQYAATSIGATIFDCKQFLGWLNNS